MSGIQQTVAGAARRPAWTKNFGQRFALLFVWAILVLGFSLARPDTYFTTGNFQTIFGSQAVLLILAMALIVPLTTGDFDLSVAANLTLTSMVVAIFQVDHGWPLLPTMLLAIAVGTLIGLINGLIVVKIGIDSFIVTLGVGTILQGVVLWISDARTITGVSNTLIDWTVTNRFLGISMLFWYGLLLTVILWYVMGRTALGKRLLFVGRGRNVALLSGINVDRVRIGALTASGFIAGLAGVAYAGMLGTADPTSGLSFLLPAFAAAYLGATTIQPGRFNPWGTFIAVFFLVSGITGLQLLGADSFVQQLFYGGALIIAVVMSELVRRRNERRRIAVNG
ncbi:MAG: ABC transporter permease [Solirubrobacterales bacterium]|nr:ABC transporter permease [Solirubrobacterales bacterium]